MWLVVLTESVGALRLCRGTRPKEISMWFLSKAGGRLRCPAVSSAYCHITAAGPRVPLRRHAVAAVRGFEEGPVLGL